MCICDPNKRTPRCHNCPPMKPTVKADNIEQVLGLMKDHGYTPTSYSADGTCYNMYHSNNGLCAEVDMVDKVVKLMYIHHLANITVSTCSFAVNHPRFKDLFEAELLVMKAQTEGV